jgi:hypothetical protein
MTRNGPPPSSAGPLEDAPDQVHRARGNSGAPGIIVAMQNPFPNADADRILGRTLESLRVQVALGRLGFDDIVEFHIEDRVTDGLAEYVENPGLLPTDDPDLQLRWLTALLDAEFAAALRRHGLSPSWGEDPGQKIEGPSLVRRRTGGLAWRPSADG